MNRIFTHSLALMLAGMFLLSFSGMRFILHHCLSCETTDVLIAGQAVDHCEDTHSRHLQGTHHPHEPMPESACCPIGDQDAAGCSHEAECCITEDLSMHPPEMVAQERMGYQIQPLALLLAFMPAHGLLFSDDPTAPARVDATWADPPWKRSGRQFIIFSHQLKIC